MRVAVLTLHLATLMMLFPVYVLFQPVPVQWMAVLLNNVTAPTCCNVVLLNGTKSETCFERNCHPSRASNVTLKVGTPAAAAVCVVPSLTAWAYMKVTAPLPLSCVPTNVAVAVENVSVTAPPERMSTDASPAVLSIAHSCAPYFKLEGPRSPYSTVSNAA